MILILPTILRQGPAWTFEGAQTNLAAVVDRIRNAAPSPVRVTLTEPIPPNVRADLRVRTNRLEDALYGLAAQTPIRLLHLASKPDQWYVVWADGTVAKGGVRLYQQSGGFVLDTAGTTMEDVVQALGERLGLDGRRLKARFETAGIAQDKIKSFRTSVFRVKDRDEEPDEFVVRLIREYLKTSGDAPEPTKRAFWNLTFLPGNPPSPGESSKIDFGAAGGPNVGANALATALTAAYAPKGDPAAKPKVAVSAVGNSSLVIEGDDDDVDEVRRLLATQFDVPQSQIMLELDAYQASADAKGRGEADQALRKLILAQQIAQAYKRAHYEAVRNTLSRPELRVAETLEGRDELGIRIPDLFRKVGIEPRTDRILNQTDVLAFLAYADNGKLAKIYPEEVVRSFGLVHDAIEARLLEPMRASTKTERELASEMARFNDALDNGASRLLLGKDKGKYPDLKVGPSPKPFSPQRRSALLGAFAQSKGPDAEDRFTREAIEEFLVLWAATADRNLFHRLKEIDAANEPRGVALTYRSAFGTRGVAAFSGQATGPDKLEALLSGDRTSKLARASARIDDLLAEGVGAIQRDSVSLVDAPLETWIDARVVEKKGSSRFGVRFGGRTRLAVTSRVPGVTGSESDSFFPYQPVAPLSLDSLIPVLSRDPVAPAATATDTASKLLLGGVAPLETAALQAVFAQASKAPYDRKLSTGLHLSVLPTMLPNGSTARLQIKLSLSVAPGADDNAAGGRDPDKPGPVSLLKSSVVETELLASAFDIAEVSSLKLDVSAPGKRDWEVPVLSQILPIRSWFVGPTQDKTVRHEAVVLIKATILPRAMDLASRSLDQGRD